MTLQLFAHLFSSYTWKALIADAATEARRYRHFFPLGAPDRD